MMLSLWLIDWLIDWLIRMPCLPFEIQWTCWMSESILFHNIAGNDSSTVIIQTLNEPGQHILLQEEFEDTKRGN